MDNLDLARWQFAITTVYHFLFVPITIGMSAIVAGYHTAYVRTHKTEYLRLTKWFGKLFTINFALGLVTGIVQEFQFGMNWSAYSRFVGDIFGAPLAFEALLAFFLESTFLGLWIFGWGRIPEKLHSWTMWLVHIGTVLSAYFILAANSFMQNPVGYRFNELTGRAEMTDFVAVLLNKVQLVTFPHVIASSYMTGAAVVMAVSLWHWLRRDHHPQAQSDRPMYRGATRVGAWVSLVAAVAVVVTGDLQGKVMTEVQPMKMASAEALYDTAKPAPFSVLSIGSLDGSEATEIIKVPGLLSFLGTGSFDGEVKGIRDIQKEYQATYGANPLTADGTYTPNIPGSYWSFRLMMGLGFVSMALSAIALWLTRKNADADKAPRWARFVVMLAPFMPLFAISFGWIFTEIGRQPWIVFGLMTTASGVSPDATVPAWMVGASMVVFTLVYAALAVVEVKLFLKYTRAGAQLEDANPSASTIDSADGDKPLVFAY